MEKGKFTILHTESSTGWAGQEMRIILEAREMKKLGHHIIIAAQPCSGIIPAIEREGFDKEIASIASRISSRKPIIIRTRHLSTPVSKGLLSRIVYQYLPHLVITTGNSIRESLININCFPHDKIVSIP